MRSIATLSFAEDMNPRFRATMEDAHAVVDDFGGAGDEAVGAGAAAAAPPPPAGDAPSPAPPAATCGFFGIYDGPGGRNVAEYLRLHLHNNVERACGGRRTHSRRSPRAPAAAPRATPLPSPPRPPLLQASCAKRATAPWKSACARRFC
jgi:hypothetical protein